MFFNKINKSIERKEMFSELVVPTKMMRLRGIEPLTFGTGIRRATIAPQPLQRTIKFWLYHYLYMCFSGKIFSSRFPQPATHNGNTTTQQKDLKMAHFTTPFSTPRYSTPSLTRYTPSSATTPAYRGLSGGELFSPLQAAPSPKVHTNAYGCRYNSRNDSCSLAC